MALCEMKNNYNPIYVIKHGILHFILMPWQFSYIFIRTSELWHRVMNNFNNRLIKSLNHQILKQDDENSIKMN